MENTKIAVLEREDLFKFLHLFYPELLMSLPEDMIMLGAIDVSEAQPRAVGLLIFHARESGVTIDWLYVDENDRRKGVGTCLLNELMRVLAEDPDESIDTVFMDFGEEAEGMGPFLRANGFGVGFFDGNYNFSAPLGKVKMITRKEEDHGLRCVPIREVKNEAFVRFSHYLDIQDDMIACVPLPIDPAAFRPESRVVMDRERIVAVLLVSDTVYRNNISIDWVYAVPKFVLTAVPMMFNDVIAALQENLPEETVLSMASVSENVTGIIEKTMPGAGFSESYNAFRFVER